MRYVSAMAVVSVPAMVRLLASCEMVISERCCLPLRSVILEKIVFSVEARVLRMAISPMLRSRSNRVKARWRAGTGRRERMGMRKLSSAVMPPMIIDTSMSLTKAGFCDARSVEDRCAAMRS